MPSARKPGATGRPPVNRLTVETPIGALTVFEENGAITRLAWAAGRTVRNPKPTPVLKDARDQLKAYFEGRLKRFSLPTAPRGTAYERKIWGALARIPCGQTLSYGSLAQKLSTGPRAVGRACGANPIPIIVPCHRVLGAGGAMHGYSGKGGVDTKAFLLRLEGGLGTG